MRFPVGFVGHGAPTNAISEDIGSAWARWAESLPAPSAILSISAHYERTPPTLSATSTMPLIYDFWGFPGELYRLTYAAPPAVDVAAGVKKLVGHDVRIDEQRGLDHGAWVPLLHMYPAADIPVIQLSLPWTDDPHRMLGLGRSLAPLRDEGVFILGSGNIVHNLRTVDFGGGPTPSWSADFDAWVEATLEDGSAKALAGYGDHPLASVCHPTREHFVPLLVAAGASSGDAPEYPVSGFELGTISRRAVQFGS